VDNYAQSHYHLYFNRKFSEVFNLNSTLFYTKGKGYFEEYKTGQDVTAYGYQPFTAGTDTFPYSDLVRRRWLDNDLVGVNLSMQWKKGLNRTILGGNYSQYFGNHYGQVIWAQFIPSAGTEDRYYSSDGDKTDMNIFLKYEGRMWGRMEYGGDLQVRHVLHSGFGTDNDGQNISFDRQYTFFNPKFWYIYHFNLREQAYISISKGSREPSRSDITDNGPNLEPKPEFMTDVEMGYKMSHEKLAFNVNAFYMGYTDQLVLTGQVNDVGAPLHINVGRSYRTGIEFMGSAQARKNVLISGNVTASSNKIRDLDIYYPNYDTVYIAPIRKENTAIGFSPSLTAALQIRWSLPGALHLQWVHKYVSRQYLDNSEQLSRSLNPYYFSEIWINKSWKLRGSILELQFQILNVFDAKYASNGYTYGYYLSPAQLVQESSVYPQAGRNYLAAVVLKF
jgi:iron complex outermembrane receptor protein